MLFTLSIRVKVNLIRFFYFYTYSIALFRVYCCVHYSPNNSNESY